MPPLLQRLSERNPEMLHYLGVSYGLTSQLLRWVLPYSLRVRRVDEAAQVLEESGLCPAVPATDHERADRRAQLRHGSWAEQLA